MSSICNAGSALRSRPGAPDCSSFPRRHSRSRGWSGVSRSVRVRNDSCSRQSSICGQCVTIHYYTASLLMPGSIACSQGRCMRRIHTRRNRRRRRSLQRRRTASTWIPASASSELARRKSDTCHPIACPLCKQRMSDGRFVGAVGDQKLQAESANMYSADVSVPGPLPSIAPLDLVVV